MNSDDSMGQVLHVILQVVLVTGSRVAVRIVVCVRLFEMVSK